MKTSIKISTFLALIFSLSMNLSVQAQDATNVAKTTYSIETDPSTFALRGYAIHLRVKTKNCNHMVWGAGTYALDLPSVLVDLNTSNKDAGWNVRINSAYSLFGEYYFKEANSKWFAGLQVGIQNYKNTNDNIPDQTSKYSNLLFMPSIGYNWQPFPFPMYIKPWMGLGYTTKVSGDNSIDGKEYDIAPLVPFLTLHVGYTFNK
jgi:hypothetical protein